MIVSHYDLYTTTVAPVQNRDHLVLPYTQAAEDAGVKLWCSGHIHRYERSKPLIEAAENASGVLHIICGAWEYQDSYLVDGNKEINLYGAPNIDRNDYCYGDDIIEVRQPNGYTDPVCCHRIDIGVSTLTWRTYAIIGGALSLYDGPIMIS